MQRLQEPMAARGGKDNCCQLCHVDNDNDACSGCFNCTAANKENTMTVMITVRIDCDYDHNYNSGDNYDDDLLG